MKTTPRAWLLLTLATASVCVLTACAKGAPEWAANVPPPPDVNDSVGTTANSSGLATLRVIVQFNQPVAFKVRYIAAVSGDTHIYSVQMPADQPTAPVLQRLAALPTITRVELDPKAKAQ